MENGRIHLNVKCNIIFGLSLPKKNNCPLRGELAMTRTPNVKFHWFFWFFFKPFLNRTCIYFFCKLGSAWDISSRCGTGLLWVYSTTVFEFYSHCHRDQVADAKCSVDKEHWMKSLDYLNAQKKGFLHCKMKWLFHLMATY